MTKDLPVQSYAAVWSNKNLSRPVAAQELIWRQPAEEVEKTSSIHRISPALSDEGVRANGAAMMLRLFLQSARRNFRSAPLVVYNAPFDLSMLSAQDYRLAETLCRFNIVDPLVIDKQLDRYRKGKRTQSALALHYGSATEEDIALAHDAAVDCRVLAGVAVEVIEKFRLDSADPSELHSNQVEWYRQQRKNFTSYRGVQLDETEQFPLNTKVTAMLAAAKKRRRASGS